MNNTPFQVPTSTNSSLGAVDILAVILYKIIPIALVIIGVILVVKGKRTSGIILIVFGSVFILRVIFTYFLLRNLF